MMASFDVQLSDTHTAVGVHLPEHEPDCLKHDELVHFPAFRTWLATLQHSLGQQSNESHAFHSAPYALRGIEIQAVDRFGGNRLGFIKLSAIVINNDGERLPGSVFLRGGSVAMFVTLQPDDVPRESETDKHVILTVQPRIPAGSLAMVEIPAGMVDDSGTFSGAAAKELKEEVDIEILENELTDMTSLALSESRHQTGESLQAGIYPSPGGSDEFIPIFLCQIRVDRESLKQWTGKLTGLREHGEKITLKLVRLENLWWEGTRDAKTLAALALYEGLRRSRKL